MFRSDKIRRFIVTIPDKDETRFLVLLGRRGLVQLDGADEKEEAFPAHGKKGSLLKDIISLEQKISLLVEELYGDEMPPGGRYTLASLSNKKTTESHAWLEEIEEKRSQYLRVEETVERAVKNIDEQIVECNKLLNLAGNFTPGEKSEYISLLYGEIGEPLRETEKSTWWAWSENRLFAMVPISQREFFREYLESRGYGDLSAFLTGVFEQGGAETYLLRLNNRREVLIRRREFLAEAFSSLLKKWRPRLMILQASAAAYTAIVSGAENFIHGERLSLFAGWIPVRNVHELKEILGEVYGASFFLHIYNKKEMRPWRGRVPVLLKNRGTLRPFETLVTVMGFPASGEVDPTPLAALAYVLMFGVMFGDLGQGLVLSLTGGLIWWLLRGQQSAVRDIGAIMVFCGFSAALFGLAYGSVFSNEHLFTPLLFNPMHNMGTLFFGAIGMGAVLIATGMIFGIINRILAGDILDAVFHFRGCAGLLLYGVFIFSAANLIFNLKLAMEVPAVLAGLSIFMVLLRPLMFRIVPGHENPLEHGLFAWFVELIVEMIETASSFLGNTISFIRAGAFALSHAGLSIAVYTLGDIVGGGLSWLGVIIVGNIFIILLEGLVCSIQAMRLEYYEFFSRFYSGKGTPYIPFIIQQQKGEEISWAVTG